MAKARVDFTCDAGKDGKQVVKKGQEIPKEFADQATRAGLAEGSVPAAKPEQPTRSGSKSKG